MNNLHSNKQMPLMSSCDLIIVHIDIKLSSEYIT